MFRRDDLGDGSLIERHPIKGGVVPPGKGPLMIRAVAAHIAKGGVSREHEQESQSMGDKLALRFLGLRETTQYTLQQSHGPSFSVALDNTTLGDEDSCGYPSLKTVRSIVKKTVRNSAAAIEKAIMPPRRRYSGAPNAAPTGQAEWQCRALETAPQTAAG